MSHGLGEDSAWCLGFSYAQQLCLTYVEYAEKWVRYVSGIARVVTFSTLPRLNQMQPCFHENSTVIKVNGSLYLCNLLPGILVFTQFVQWDLCLEWQLHLWIRAFQLGFLFKCLWQWTVWCRHGWHLVLGFRVIDWCLLLWWLSIGDCQVVPETQSSLCPNLFRLNAVCGRH